MADPALAVLDNAPAWADDLLLFGILALLIGLGLVILGNVRRSRYERRSTTRR